MELSATLTKHVHNTIEGTFGQPLCQIKHQCIVDAQCRYYDVAKAKHRIRKIVQVVACLLVGQHVRNNQIKRKLFLHILKLVVLAK